MTDSKESKEQCGEKRKRDEMSTGRSETDKPSSSGSAASPATSGTSATNSVSPATNSVAPATDSGASAANSNASTVSSSASDSTSNPTRLAPTMRETKETLARCARSLEAVLASIAKAESSNAHASSAVNANAVEKTIKEFEGALAHIEYYMNVEKIKEVRRSCKDQKHCDLRIGKEGGGPGIEAPIYLLGVLVDPDARTTAELLRQYSKDILFSVDDLDETLKPMTLQHAICFCKCARFFCHRSKVHWIVQTDLAMNVVSSYGLLEEWEKCRIECISCLNRGIKEWNLFYWMHLAEEGEGYISGAIQWLEVGLGCATHGPLVEDESKKDSFEAMLKILQKSEQESILDENAQKGATDDNGKRINRGKSRETKLINKRGIDLTHAELLLTHWNQNKNDLLANSEKYKETNDSLIAQI